MRGSEPLILFVRLIPNNQTEQFNAYDSSRTAVNERWTDPSVGDGERP